MSAEQLPTLNALLNFLSLVWLITGFVFIKKGNRIAHRRAMIGALCASTLFFVSYLIYHQQVGSVPYLYNDWTRPLYFAILVPHIILAALMIPFIITGVILAIRQRFETHRRVMRWVWPVWVFVSLSGIIVFLMLYRL